MSDPGGTTRHARTRIIGGALVFVAAGVVISTSAQSPSDSDPTPHTLDDFKAAASRVLTETAVPGAGVALVTVKGVEWVGGFGYADRERQTPITGDTHFRVGSISKTFVALALVQLYEDDVVDLMAPVDEIAPNIAIDNPWHHTDPVRVIHLLQHTAGFDDMHFNERYVPAGETELTLAEVLRINPRSRRVRWRPGTRMSYFNPGYAIAGLLIEKLTGQPYEDYIKRQIFDPLGMTTSSFRLTSSDEALLARGYAGSDAEPVGFPRIYLRPAGNMHSSPREMAQLVRMQLGWGKIASTFVVDPEYLGSMEQPRTSYASMAGLRNGYGSGIAGATVAALSTARTRRRHRWLPVAVRLFAVARCRLRHSPQQHWRPLAGSDESSLVAGNQISETGRRAAAEAGEQSGRHDARSLRGLLP